jgi:hypothetical protein
MEEERERPKTASNRSMLKQPPPSIHGEEIGREGLYIAHAKGVVRDTNTGFERVAGPDREMSWKEAKEWVESLYVGGGGGRMPMANELKTPYQRGKETRKLTSLLNMTG